MTEETLTTAEPFTDAATCLEEWFCVLGPLTGFPCTDHPSGILPFSGRLPEINLLLARTTATGQAGTVVPVLDALDALGLDLLDGLLTLALLRTSMDSRLRQGLRFRELCEAVGAAERRDQADLRKLLEEEGALRRLSLRQSDADTLEAERLYRFSPERKSPILAVRTEPERVELPGAAATRLQAAVVEAIELLSCFAPGLGIRTSGWAHPVSDGPGWDHLGSRRRALSSIASVFLDPDGPAHRDPLDELLAGAGVVRPAEVVFLVILLGRRREDGPLSWAVLGPALSGIPGSENGFDGLLSSGSALLRQGLVELRSEATEGPLAAFSATPQARGLAIPLGILFFQSRSDAGEQTRETAADVEVSTPRLDGIVPPRAVRDRIEEALVLPRPRLRTFEVRRFLFAPVCERLAVRLNYEQRAFPSLRTPPGRETRRPSS